MNNQNSNFIKMELTIKKLDAFDLLFSDSSLFQVLEMV